MEQKDKYLVCTRCYTFNHAKYIEDTMDGFTMQQTNFPFVCVIVDDASTDGEPEVIKRYLSEHFQEPYRTEDTEYAHIICAHHKTNSNCDFVVFLLKYNHYSIKKSKMQYLAEWTENVKYHALCEGDDYWIHPKKLQKQVGFLELHSDYGLVYTNRYNLKDGKLTKIKASGRNDALSILVKTGIATLTSCFRKNLFYQYLKDVAPEAKPWLMGDSPLWKYLAFHSKVYLMPDYTSVYRILPESASHSSNIDKRFSFTDSILDIQKYMLEKYVTDPSRRKEVEREIISDYHLRYLNIYLSFGKYNEAKSYIRKNWKSIRKKDLFTPKQMRVFVSALVRKH